MTRRNVARICAAPVVALVASVLTATTATAQLPRVGIIDLYGLRKTTAAQVREALGINVGDSLTAASLFEVPARLADLRFDLSSIPACPNWDKRGSRPRAWVGYYCETRRDHPE